MKRIYLTRNGKQLFLRLYSYGNCDGLEMPKSVRRQAFLQLKQLKSVEGYVK